MPRMDEYDVKANPAPADLVLIIDVEDGSQSPDGTTKLATVGSFPGGGSGGAVASVFGRTGAVAAQTGDYTAAQVGADASGAAAAAQTAAQTYADTNKLAKSANLSDVASRQAALDTLTGSQSAGKYLRSDGTHATLVAIQAADLPAGIGDQAYQFRPETYGAKGDGAFLYDAHMDGTTAILTTAGLPAPAFWFNGATQITGSGTGGSIGAGVVQVRQTYVNQFGESLASAAASYTASGTTSSITSNSPAPWTNATSYNTYATAPGGSTFFKQNSTPTPLRTSFKITSINTGGANPPVSNTSNSAPFTAGDVGKAIIVTSAGGFLNVPLVTTIASYQSATQVTLAAASSRAVTGQGAVYGTDDTTAIQNAINAAVAYAQTAGSEHAIGEVVFGDKIYCVAGAPGGTYQNAQIQIPYVDPQIGPKVNLKLTGPQEANGPVHWEQPNPPASGCTIASIFYYDNQNGQGPPPNVVIGGPVENASQGIFFGGDGGLFSNMRVVVDGINVLAAYRSCVGGLDLFGVGQAYIKSFSYFCMAATSTAAGGWPSYQPTSANPSAWSTFGYRTPYLGNNDQNDLDTLTAYGSYFGVMYADHFSAGSIKAINTYFATCASGGGHHCTIQSLSSELTFAPINNDGTAPQSLFVASLHCENATNIVYDTSNEMYGEVRFEQQGAPGTYYSFLRNGGKNIKVTADSNAPGPVASPQAPPVTGVAWMNGYGHDAEITVSVSGGTMTTLSIDGVDQIIPAGCVVWKFFLPEGHSYTPTYTGTFSHTVTLA